MEYITEKERKQINATDPALTERTVQTYGIDSPRGSDNLNSRELFKERLFYREEALDQLQYGEAGVKDFWYNIHMYGTLDIEGYPIYPSATFLKQFTSAGETIFGLNFVVDAFEEMASYCERYVAQAPGSFSRKASSLIPFNVYRGWTSARKSYQAHIERFYDVFTNGYLVDIGAKILNFEEFLHHMEDFANSYATQVPLTYSGFLRSSYNSSFTSGLVLEVSDIPYGDDEAKFKEIYDDPKFELYRRAAQIHGFIIDKNIPFRLYTNLNHPKMRDGIKRNITFSKKSSPRDLFKNVYYLAHREDIMYMRFFAAAMYNNYVSIFPAVEIPQRQGTCNVQLPKFDRGVRKTFNRKHYREKLNAFGKDKRIDKQSAYYKKYDDLFWIKFYLKQKVSEFGLTMSDKECSRELRKYYDEYRTSDLNNIVDKIMKKLTRQRQKFDEVIFRELLSKPGQDAKSLLSSKVTSGTTPPGSLSVPLDEASKTTVVLPSPVPFPGDSYATEPNPGTGPAGPGGPTKVKGGY
tara:strand:+ start:120 stop:1682 length:1563 start_codon:yes stop_codon:yes gene_type:complete